MSSHVSFYLIAYTVFLLIREYSTVLPRMKGSFSVDFEKTLSEICHERNGSFMIVRWFCFSRSRISVALTALSASVLFVTGNSLLDNSAWNLVLDAFTEERDFPNAF